jgi:translation initiation factor 5A
MSDENYEFEQAAAGASLTYPMEAGALRKNGHAMMKGKPCKIVDIAISKTGKHGHAKAAFTGIDIFTGKKYEDMCPTSHNMEVPNVSRVEFQLLDLDADTGSLSVLLDNGDTKDDLNLPGETDDDRDRAEKLKAAFEDGKALLVTVLRAMDQEKIVDFKEMAN